MHKYANTYNYTNMHNIYMFIKNIKHYNMGEYFLNANKRSFLSKKQMFTALKKYNVELY